MPEQNANDDCADTSDGGSTCNDLTTFEDQILFLTVVNIGGAVETVNPRVPRLICDLATLDGTNPGPSELRNFEQQAFECGANVTCTGMCMKLKLLCVFAAVD